MPIKMLLKCRHLTSYMICTSSGKIIPNRPQKIFSSRSKLDDIPTKSSNCGGEKSLLTKRVRLYSEYLMGEEASVPPGFQGRLAGALWGSGAQSAGGRNCVGLCATRGGVGSHQSGGRHTGLRLKRHTAVFIFVLSNLFI